MNPFRRFIAPSLSIFSAGLMSVSAPLWIFDSPFNTAPLKFSVPTPTAPSLSYADLIAPTANRVGVNVALVKSIVKAESAFNPDAVSCKGALGLMQVMPETAKEMGLDAAKPVENLDFAERA